MVNLETADKALKSVYLGVVTEQLNTAVNPLLTKIEQTSSDVWGKDIIKLVSYGLNGGVGAGDETGSLPMAAGNNYAQYKVELKNLYGSIEISDKAIRASQSNVGAFVNLLNAEMEGLLKASKYNLGRMLYGDGNGVLALVATASATATTSITLSSVKKVAIGMVIDIFNKDGEKILAQARIIDVDRVAKIIKIDKQVSAVSTTDYITIQNSKGFELTGLGAIFGTNDIYGLARANNTWLNPYKKDLNNAALDMGTIQEAIDYIDETTGSAVNFITCAYDVKKAYIKNLSANRLNVDYMTLDGGFKALSYSGIPLVSDKFIEDGEMYLLNTDDFKMHQLCDWRWLEGDNGNVIKQKLGNPTYTATLVKYADIVCDRPCGQAKLSGIKCDWFYAWAYID